MPGIDYSKWDRLDYSSDSTSDVEAEYSEDGATHVTRLEYPSRVTLGPNGVRLEHIPPVASASPFSESAQTGTTNISAPHGLIQQGSREHEEAAFAKEDEGRMLQSFCSHSDQLLHSCADPEMKDAAGNATATDDDEDMLYESLALNGGREGTQHWWAQTEDTITVSFLVPWETVGKSVTHFHLYDAPDPQGGSELHHTQLDFTIQTPPTSLTNSTEPAAPFHVHRIFRYPVKITEELVEGCWQLHRMPRRHLRLLVVQLFKEPVGAGLKLWWAQCFITDTISVIADTHTLPGRVRRLESTPGAKEKAAQFQQVWAEAHEEFRRRVRERKGPQ